MFKKLFLFLFIIGVGILVGITVRAQTCPHIYQGINCGDKWYCGGCVDVCPVCPQAGDPVGATELNYVNCTCNCPAGEIVCNNTCVDPNTLPVCPTDTRETISSCEPRCGDCKAGYSPDPLNPDPPSPCLKTAFMDYTNIGDFKISGGSPGGDLYLPNGNAIRIDGAGTTTLFIGNWGGGPSLDVTILGGLVVGSPTDGSKGLGTVNAEQLCIQGSCRNTWPEAVNAFIDEGNVGFGPTAVLGTNDNFPLAFETNNVERMRLNTAGNLGIGTTDPGAYMLKVMGDVNLANGNFTIDTAVGNAQVWGAVQAGPGTTSVPSFSFRTDTNTGLYSPSADNIGFAIGGTERVRIDNAGNVGIGTTGPSGQMHVYNSTTSTDVIVESDATNASLSIDSAANNDAGISLREAGTNKWRIVNDGSDSDKLIITGDGGLGTDDFLTIDQNGNVGIGTSTPGTNGAKFEVKNDTARVYINAPSGNPELDLGNGTDHWSIYRNTAPDQLRFWRNDNRMVITSDGKVGIGTVAPGYKLDVAGDGRIGEHLGVGVIPSATRNLYSFETFSGGDGYYKGIESYVEGDITSGYLYGVESKSLYTGAGSIVSYGVYGGSNNVGGGTVTNSYGVYGISDKTGGGTVTNGYGGYFTSNNATTNYGVYGTGGGNVFGVLGYNAMFGAFGQYDSDTYGILGLSEQGVYGQYDDDNYGKLGDFDAATGTGSGVSGRGTGAGGGFYTTTDGGVGVVGRFDPGNAVIALAIGSKGTAGPDSEGSTASVTDARGVYGKAGVLHNLAPGSSVNTAYGVYGEVIEAAGTVGTGYGGYFNSTGANTNYGVYGEGANYGVYGTGEDMGGYFKDSDESGYAKVGYGDTGIEAYGADQGGYFKDSDESGYAKVGYGNYGIQAYGDSYGGRFGDSNSSGYALVGFGNYGIQAVGNTAGGLFQDSDSSGYAYAGWSDYGIMGYGNFAGGYFEDLNESGEAYVGYGNIGIEARGSSAGGYFEDSDLGNSGYAYVGYGDNGISAYGDNQGGYFEDSNSSGYAEVGSGNYGIKAYGNTAGGYFEDPGASGYARVGYSGYGIYAEGNSRGGYFKDRDDSGWARVGYGDRGIHAFGTEYAGYFSGNVRITGTHPDLAEIIPTSGKVEPGDVVMIDPTEPNRFKKNNKAYNTAVAGVISEKPAQLIEGEETENLPESQKAPLALVGRIKVKVTDEGGKIRIGDLLTTASTLGYAMKCDDKIKCIGAVIGKALEPFYGKAGTIKMIVTLQ